MCCKIIICCAFLLFFTSQSEPLLTAFLNQYKRPFTVLELDKAEHAFWITEKYNAVCIIAGVNQGLLEQCKPYSNVVLLQKSFMPSELQHLGQCERFDVILAHDIRQQFGNQWKEAVDAVFNLGDYAIFWVRKDDSSLKEYIEENTGSLIGDLAEEFQLYITKAQNNLLWRKTWLWRVLEQPYAITSSFIEKKLIKPSYWPPNSSQESQWLPGINLLTFKMCNGVYPTNEMIKKSMYDIKDYQHSDWMINNMVLQGDKLVWIDINDYARSQGAILKASPLNQERYDAHLELLDLTDSTQIEHFFWNKLIHVPVGQKHIVSLIGKLIEPFSLVFDINPIDERLICAYLGYATKVIAFNVLDVPTHNLEHNFYEEECIVVSKDILKHHLSSLSLDGFIDLYGKPYLCNLNLFAKDAYEYFACLTKEIPVVSFKYDLTDRDSLKKCIDALLSKGYKKFNFTIRDFKFLALFENNLSGKGCDWVAGDILLQKIEEFNRLDTEHSPLCGYVYAKKVNK